MPQTPKPMPKTEPPPPTSGVTEDDVSAAKLAWKQSAPPEFRDLLDATEQ